MRARGRVIATCLLAVLLATPTAVAAGTAPVATPDPVDGSTALVASAQPVDDADGRSPPAELAGATQDDNESNETTVQHEDPDAVDGAGDLGAVKGWLSSRMLDSLRESSFDITQEQYEAGRSALGDEYTSLLGQYVDVAGDTDTRTDDRTGNALNATRNAQEDYANTSQAYAETYDAYQAAKANGNDARARELARELTSLAAELRRYQRRLNETYARLGNLTDRDLTAVVERFEGATENVTEEASSVQATELVATELDVDAADGTASFLDPAVLRGRLRVLGNASLPDRIRLRVGGRSRTVDVAANGSFSARYRPRTDPVGARSLAVAYVPEPTSLYVGSNDSVDLAVESVTPRVSVDRPSAAAYGESVPIAGRVTVGGTPVDDVPVVVTVDGRRLATVRTDADGRYRATPRLPADVPPGDVTVRVRAGREGRAVAANVTETTLRVESTDTDLSLDATAVDDGVRVTGTLETDDGTPVADQRVVLRVAGERVGFATTDGDGRYRATADVLSSAQRVTVRVVYDATGTNLENSSASQRVERAPDDAAQPQDASQPDGAGRPGGDAASPGLLARLVAVGPYLGGGVALVLAAAAAVRWRRRSAPAPDDDDVEWATDPKPARPDDATDAFEDRLDDLADAVPTVQVQSAYSILADTLRRRLGLSRTATHWELYRAVAEDRSAIEDDLRTVVEAYEQVTFAETPVDAETAAAVLAAARDVERSLTTADAEASARDDHSAADDQ